MASGYHVKNSGGANRFVIIAIVAAAVLALIFLFGSIFCVFAGGKLVSRNETHIDLSDSGMKSTKSLLRLKAPEEIDLRGNDLDGGDYKSLAAAFPECSIRWDVPLGGVGESWDNFSESVTVPVFSKEAAELYSYMPLLKEVDLREAKVSPEDYELLRSLIPDCHIRWSVPIADEYWDSDSRSLSFGNISPEEVKLFSYFTALESLALTGSSHAAYMELEHMFPHWDIQRNVTLAQHSVSAADKSADLSAVSVSYMELMENLVFLPELKNIKLNSSAFGRDELEALREAYPGVSFEYDIYIGGKTFSCLDKIVAPGKNIKAGEFISALSAFVAPEILDLKDCGYSIQELLSVAEICPDAMIQADVELYGKSFSTESSEIDLSGTEIEDVSIIESALPLFPNLKKVIMSDCGISDEDMDALNRRHENVQFVWTLHFSVYNVRTDASAFCASNVPGLVAPKLGDYDLAPIKYLTELEALDLGHMYYSDLSFLENMPKLRYLILVEASYRDISAIAGLSELYYLELFNNTINDLSPLLECKKLRHLNIGFTRGYDASVLKEMTYLERLWLPGSLLEQEEMDAIAAALPDTDCYFAKWDGAGSTGGGWREHDSYFEMRDIFDMHYMPGGTGVPNN